MPTVAEAGVPGYVFDPWFGILAPAKTPKDMLNKLNREIARILQLPDVKERLSGMGADPVGSTPEEFGAFIRSETEKWARVVKFANLYHSQ